MKYLFCLLFLVAAIARADERPRLLVLTDIGGDPDDQQSLIRLMVYANQFNIEGLVASASGTPGELKTAVVRPDLIREIVKAYGKVRSNLARHDDGWPTIDDLLPRIKSGNPQRGKAHVGSEHDTEGSRWIVERVNAGTPQRPLNISIWGGQTDLAQALWRVRHDHGTAGLASFVQRLRVYDIQDQDGIADWMRTEFPGMFYILSKAPVGSERRQSTYRGMYLGGDESLTTREWVEKHVRGTGPLGELYPLKTSTAPNPHGCLKEGDTPSWFFFLPTGGNDPSDPLKPGWGGRYQKTPDGWYRDLPPNDGVDPRQSVSRWRVDFQQDFARRMNWCLPGQNAQTPDNQILPTHTDMRYGPYERNVLDLYLADSQQPTPLVLYIHGGGFMGGDKRSIKRSDLQSFLNAGFSVAALNYRLTSTAPAPAAYLDCGRSLQFLRHNAAKWNIDPSRIASTGGSAGAGISMWLAFHDDLADPDSDDPVARQSTRLTCIAVSDGQSSYDPIFAEKIGIPRPNFERHQFFLPFYGIRENEIDTPQAYRRYEEMAPITYLSKEDPPALLDYNFPNDAVDSKTELRLIVHHPLFGIALKEQMDHLGIHCTVQYVDRHGKKVRHSEEAPPLMPVQFIKEQFEKMKSVSFERN